MTIGRRQAFGLGALGLGAFAVDGCGFLPWGATAPAVDVDQLLRDLDHVVAQLETLDPDPKKFGIKPGKEFDEGRATSLRLLTTLCFMGTYRHVPEDVWRHPRVEKRLAETLPQIHDTIRAARNRLVEMTDEEALAIEKRLQQDPELPMRIMERVDEYAKQIDVPIEQRTYLRTATAQLAARFRYEGAREVTSKLTAKYDKTLASRKSELGFPTDAEPATEQTTQATGLRARFRTRASEHDIRVAACAIEPKVMIDGVPRRVVLDSEAYRCTVAPSDQPPIAGTVEVEPAEGGENIVTVVLYTSDQGLSTSLRDIALHLREVLGSSAASSTAQTPKPPRLGVAGESCRTRDDCQALDCTESTCGGPETGSKKLMRTTKKIAFWGAILLIPPLCAIGVLVLLQCLFMVIVAGCMAAAGD